MMKQLYEGELVRIRRSKWNYDSGPIGVIVKQTYMAYDVKDSRWQVLVGDEIKVYRAENLSSLSNRS